MSDRFLLSLDLGGGGLRCALFSTDGRVAARTRRALPPQTAAVSPLSSVFEPEALEAAADAAVRDVVGRSDVRPEQVVGVSATSMRHASVLLDAEGRALLATSNRDACGTPFVLSLARERCAALQQRTGHWPHPIFPAARLRGLAAERPELYARARTHLALSDWLLYRLCGERGSEPTQAAASLLLDLRERDWSAELAAELGVRAELLPPLNAPGTRLGALRPAAAAALGLAAGTPVAVGAADTQCALLGAGAVAPGQLALVLGTSAAVQQVLAAPREGDLAHLWQEPHVPPQRWVLESNAGGVGAAVEWLAGALFPDRAYPVLQLLDAASRSPVGALGLTSTFGVDVMDARSPDLPLGSLALSALVAESDPDRLRHVARAFLEGLAFGLRANAEQLVAASGAQADGVLAVGGLARSPFFTQLLADVLGRPVEVPECATASGVGAAICAGVGAGVFTSLAEGAAAWVRPGRRHEPTERAAAYDGLYAAWRRERGAQREVDARRAAALLPHVLAPPPREQATAGAPRPRLLVTAELDEASLAALRELGEVEYAPFRRALRVLAGPALVEALRGVDVLVTEVDVVDADALAASGDLRAIFVCRGDAVNVDVEACTALGIPVLRAPGRNAEAVADLTLALLLALARKLPAASAFLREPGGEAGDLGRMGRAYDTLRGQELGGRTVGLVGLGAVGRRVVSRLRACGARCVAADPNLSPDAVRLAGAEPVSLADLLATSDFVSLHAAASPDAGPLLGAAQLARMKPGAFLVNTARGALVDEEALAAALASGRLAGAALDVFAEEPPAADHPLLALPNVLATPHVAGNTVDVAAHQGRQVVEALRRLLRGERPDAVLNPETLGHISWGEPRRAPVSGWREALGERPTVAVTDLQRRARRAGAPGAAAAAATAPPAVRERFQAVLRAFAGAVRGDAALAQFAKSAGDVTLHFTLPDVGSEFHLRFRAGAASAGLGPPDAPAEVRLKLSADLFDGMLTGRRNPMQAALAGELAFSGDAALAMTLNRLEADLGRLYAAARERAGDPGDLRPPRAASAPAPDAPVSARGAGDERDALVAVVRELYDTGLITATGGNVSVRAQDPGEVWITPGQLFKGDLSHDVLVRVDLEGRTLDPDARSPSSETLMHTAVLRARSDVQAVIHAHAPNATILANTDIPFLPISTEAAFFRRVGRVPFIMPGTRQLADAVVEALGDGWAVLLRNHGLLVAGRSLRRAADMTEIVERSCEVILGCRAAGVDPPCLPPDVVEELAALGDLMA